VLDLDGTLYCSWLPAWTFGATLARALPPRRRLGYLARLEAVLDGRASVPEGVGDAWEAAVVLAFGPGVRPHERVAEFEAARRAVLAVPGLLVPPRGLVDFVTWLSRRASLYVVTNSERRWAEEVLDRLSVARAIHGVLPSARKPERLGTLLADLAEEVGGEPASVVLLGDNFPVDVAPAITAGAVTVHVDPHGFGGGKLLLRPDLRVRRLEEAFDFLGRFVDGDLERAALCSWSELHAPSVVGSLRTSGE